MYGPEASEVSARVAVSAASAVDRSPVSRRSLGTPSRSTSKTSGTTVCCDFTRRPEMLRSWGTTRVMVKPTGTRHPGLKRSPFPEKTRLCTLSTTGVKADAANRPSEGVYRAGIARKELVQANGSQTSRRRFRGIHGEVLHLVVGLAPQRRGEEGVDAPRGGPESASRWGRRPRCASSSRRLEADQADDRPVHRRLVGAEAGRALESQGERSALPGRRGRPPAAMMRASSTEGPFSTPLASVHRRRDPSGPGQASLRAIRDTLSRGDEGVRVPRVAPS